MKRKVDTAEKAAQFVEAYRKARVDSILGKIERRVKRGYDYYYLEGTGENGDCVPILRKKDLRCDMLNHVVNISYLGK